MNYKSLHTAMKSSVASAGFTYKPLHEWLNIDLGIFPASLVDRAFSIRFDGQNDDSAMYDTVNLSAAVEFILDARNDAYLDKLDDTTAAVKSLNGIQGNDHASVLYNWRQCPYTVRHIGEWVLLTYELKITIEV